MPYIALLLLLALTATTASAQHCPDRYRFVDFGLEDLDGIMRRGGTIFRAFDPEGTHLLKPEGTTCRDVTDLAIDGRALKIPVVSTIAIDPEAAQIAFLTMQVQSSRDVTALAAQKATPHRGALTAPDAITARGDRFLCVEQEDGLSCQIVSPYRQNAALVVYCSDQTCRMPVLGLHPTLFVSASWAWDGTTGKKSGDAISEKILSIRDFLSNHIQGLKRA